MMRIKKREARRGMRNFFNKAGIEVRQPGFALVELILVSMVILFLLYTLVKVHFKEPVVNKETAEVLRQEGINTTSHKSTVESMREKIRQVERQDAQRVDEIENR